MFSRLIFENFFVDEKEDIGEKIVGVLMPSENRCNGVLLDKYKTIVENGIVNNDTIGLVYPSRDGGDIDIYCINVEIEKKEQEILNDIKNKKRYDYKLESLLELLEEKKHIETYMFLRAYEKSDKSLDEVLHFLRTFSEDSEE